MVRAFILTLALLALSPAAFAQEAEQPRETGLDITDTGKEYSRVIRKRRINGNVAYFDPSAPAPDLKTDQEPPKERETQIDGDAIEQIPAVAKIISFIVLAGIIYLFIRYGSGMSIAVRSAADNPERARRRKAEQQGSFAHIPADLASILKIADRREALVALAQGALARAVSSHGLLWHKSWTARDALRQLPRDQQHRKALADLVAFGERVHFGGRDVSEDDFDIQLEAIRPLFQEATV